jgi:hypothetical protein
LARINHNGTDEEQGSALANAVEQSLSSIVISSNPIFICGVNRRVNLGNWEHLDIYGGITLPMPGASIEDLEALKEIAMYAAEIGFNISSAETGQRYKMIKDAQKPAREPTPTD